MTAEAKLWKNATFFNVEVHAVLHIFSVRMALLPVHCKQRNLNLRYSTVEVLHFSYLRDPEVDKVQNLTFFLVRRYICGQSGGFGEIFRKIPSVVFT